MHSLPSLTIPNRCGYCGNPFPQEDFKEGQKKPPRSPLCRSKDHVVPLSKGGIDAESNWLWCCYSCNSLKSDDSLDVFLGKVFGLIPVLTSPLTKTCLRINKRYLDKRWVFEQNKVEVDLKALKQRLGL